MLEFVYAIEFASYIVKMNSEKIYWETVSVKTFVLGERSQKTIPAFKKFIIEKGRKMYCFENYYTRKNVSFIFLKL